MKRIVPYVEAMAFDCVVSQRPNQRSSRGELLRNGVVGH